jgi:hypothetical protein
MHNEGHANPQIGVALKRLGFKTSTRSLKRCLQRWGRRRPVGTPGVRIGGVGFNAQTEAIPRNERPNAPMPQMTPLMTPPRRRLNRRNERNGRHRMPRKEAQVPGRVAGPQTKEAQLQCNRCQIAVVSHKVLNPE